MPKLDLNRVPVFFHGYINLVDEDNLQTALTRNTEEMMAAFRKLTADKWTYRYAAGKWSIKEMVQHIIDAERIFCYRALCIARGETQSLPGFDEETYATASRADTRSPDDLLTELGVVRHGSELLFASLEPAQLLMVGRANNHPISAEAIGFIIPGHVKHHLNVLESRYLR